MEPYHFGNLMDNEKQTESYVSISGSYDFSQDSLANIPYPEDSCMDEDLSEDIELPPPPGALDNEPLPPFEFKSTLKEIPHTFSPSLPPNEDIKTSNIPMPDTLENDPTQHLPPLPPSPFEDNQTKNYGTVVGTEVEGAGDPGCEAKKYIDDSNRYSPSKVDSDDENQDAAVKPKVLGKEQAKKRLMAFSLSKQPNTAFKKQIITPAKTSKEKPPNPNKSSGVQEQFRATISAIEEEKKKMMQNMPNYLLQEMNDLTKSTQPIMKSSTQPAEKNKNDNVVSSAKDNKDDSYSNKTSDASKSKDSSKRGTHRSRSRSRSNRRSTSRSKRRRRSRSKRRSRSQSRSRRRSRSRSRSKRSKSRNRRTKEEKEKNFKSEKKDNNSLPKKDVTEDWKSFKNAGFKIDCDLGETKQTEDSTSQKEDRRRRSPSPKSRHEFKPIYNYLKTNKLMAPLRVRSIDHGNPFVLYSEKTIKYTKAKPVLIWAENPARATEFYMSKEMLLENCDQTTASILEVIIDNKNKISLDCDKSLGEEKLLKYRPWYPRHNYLTSITSNLYLDLETDFKQSVEEANKKLESEISDDKNKGETTTESKEEKEKTRKRHISLVNDSYMSDDEDKIKEMVVGDVKVQMDLGMNSVKVRSKWDSDYEGETSEREAVPRKEEDMEISTPEKQSEVTPENCSTKEFLVRQTESKSKEKIAEDSPVSLASNQIQFQEVSEAPTGNLVSEYEEFLKMVSFDSNEPPCVKSQESFSNTPTTIDKPKTVKPDEETQKSSKIASTDWDQESDREEKSAIKNLPLSKTTPEDDFFIMDEEKSKKKKNKKVKPKKKIEKVKSKKGKQMKKSGKGKKKKYEDSSSSDSSSDSYDSRSDSDSDSENSRTVKKKKKKKFAKAKKKSRKDSSSESDSESDDIKSKKKKSKKKKGGKKKKNTSSGSDEEVQNALLKQLDFKKQLIMKKIEEIDSISERSGKKKEKDIRLRKKENSEETESIDKYPKSVKKKKLDGKLDKYKKKLKTGSKKSKGEKDLKNKSSSESESDSSVSNEKRKRGKKEGKKKHGSSESSDDENEEIFKSSRQDKLIDIKNIKLDKKTKRIKKKKKKDFASSDSDSDNSSSKIKKKIKKKKNKNKGDDEKVVKDESSRTSWKENFMLDEAEFKTEEELRWRNKKTPWKRLEKKSKTEKREDDWEKSSSEEEFKKEDSSWDEEAPRKIEIPKKDDKSNTAAENEVNEKTLGAAPEAVSQPVADTLKTSLSNFSFNENSFCSYGQELSRDFFFTSSSVPIGTNADSVTCAAIESRPFQSLSKNVETKNPAESELYSPGHSDSEMSDLETNDKSERTNSNSNAASTTRDEVYDPLNCESETSVDNNEIELSSIPLPRVSDILLPGETRIFKNIGVVSSPSTDSNQLKNEAKNDEYEKSLPVSAPILTSKALFTLTDFTPVAASQSPFSDEKGTPTKKQLMSVKAQPKLKSKAASVFQDESDEENIEPSEKGKGVESAQNDIKNVEVSKAKVSEKQEKTEGKEETSRRTKEERARSRDRSSERDRKRIRSLSRERKDSSKHRMLSPSRRRRSRTPETKLPKEKKEIKSDSFEIEPLKGSTDANEIEQTVQPIPVLTGLGAPTTDRIWNRSHLPGYSCSDYSGNLIDHAESFDIYPSEDPKSRNRNLDKDWDEGSGEKSSNDKSSHKEERSKKERRKSRSRSLSPRKRRRSKSPDRRKSPRKRSASPKRRDRSSYSPRRKSPKRKSPSRRYRSSRSPDRRRKSRSRSPRKRRGSPSRRSRSMSPRRHRSPKRRGDSPRRRDSLSRAFNSRGSMSPKKDSQYSHGYSTNRIPVIGGGEDAELEMSPSGRRSPRFDASMGFSRHVNSTMCDTEMNNSFYNREYADEFGLPTYSEDTNANNLITLKNHEIEKPNSPERLSLDQRIELELGVQLSGSQNEQYPMSNQQFPEHHFQSSYAGDNNANDGFYQNSDFNGQYFNGHQQPSNYGPFQQYPNSQSVQSSVMQVGNIVEVVPAMQPPPSKAHQIMQVGNVLQVVPSPKVGTAGQMPLPGSHNFGPPSVTPLKTQKATAVVAPSSIIPTPNPDAVINPLIKAIQLEREKRRKEKEKRKTEREARRKARQLRREAKLMSVNEKLKKSVQDEGLMLGQEVEDEELLDSLDLPSPPIPVEIITVSQSTLPPAGKGILISAGFMPKPPSEKKEVKFADGVCPGEGTSTSGGEDIASPPPKPKLPKEKRFKKKKTKVKKKVKVQIIRQIIQDEDDDDDDDLSPPPPPPGDPPPVFFARFPFAGDAQFPVYQTQTTTTTLTTVQYPTQSFQ